MTVKIYASDEELWDYIVELLDLLDDMNVDTEEYHDRWNFITDIVTNEIRAEGLEEARSLALAMETAYQNLHV